MTRRYIVATGILIAMMLFLPAITVIPEAGGQSTPPPSRYGFTFTFKDVATPASEALSVATGDVDNRNNDDIAVGMQNQIVIYTNNGGTGPSFGFSLYRTVSLTGDYITDLEVVDYDGDSDMDIIALGQEQYYMANDQGTAGPTIGRISVIYVENTGSAFSVETRYDATDAIYANADWATWDGKFDMTTGDLDNDDDVDAAIIYGADTDGDTGAERIRVTAVYYESGSISTDVLYDGTPEGTWTWGFLQAADLDEDGYVDIAFVRVLRAVHVIWNSNLGFDPSSSIGEIPEIANANRIPYALALGHFAGDGLLDIIVSTNDSPDYWNSDGKIYCFKQKASTTGKNTFSEAELTYGEAEHFNFFRGFAVGHLSNDTTYHGDDVVTFTKQVSDRLTVQNIDGFGITALKSETYSPKKLALMKYYGPDYITQANVNAIALGQFDNDPDGYDDLVYVGSTVTTGTLSWPLDQPPTIMRDRTFQSPSPVLNDNKQVVTMNITVEDKDGAWDLTRMEVDFTSIPGMEDRIVLLEEPTWPARSERWLTTIAAYKFSLKVPPEVPEGIHEITVRMFGREIPNSTAKSVETLNFRVEQFNRPPYLNLDDRLLEVQEDVNVTFEGVYSWFDDKDEDNILIKIKNPFIDNSYMMQLDNPMFNAELINYTNTNHRNIALRITPKANKFHSELGSNLLVLRAFDDSLESEELPLEIKIFPVNDPANIPADKNQDFRFDLEQDDYGIWQIKAYDPLDGDEDGQNLEYMFEYEDPSDEEWLTITGEGKITWRPLNEHVGPHRVTLIVNDSYEMLEKEVWFNVSNLVDLPFYMSISNATTTIDLITDPPSGRLEFVVYEHEEFSLTVKVDDPDRYIAIGAQTNVIFQCNLTQVNNTLLTIDPMDPFAATLSFLAESKFGYQPTYGEESKPIDTEFIIVDPEDPERALYLPIRIRIINVNDPPLPVVVASPDEGTVFPILYNHQFVAGSGLDPDTNYGDNLTFVWDFDHRDGIGEDRVGTTVFWDFPQSGNYRVTLRVMDSAGLFKEAMVNITANGIRNDTDWDNDGIPNDKEMEYGFNPYDPSDAMLDSDGDHLTNLEEFLNQTNPIKADSDGDGIWDDEDYDPLNKDIWERPVEEEQWYDDPLNLMLLIVIIIVVLLIVIILMTVIVLRSRKKAQEEEEKRKLAEEMQKSMYEGQDLYENLPSLQQPSAPEVQAEAALPAAPKEELDDIFGGAGILPGTAGQQQAPAPQAPAGQEPPKSDDLSDLLD